MATFTMDMPPQLNGDRSDASQLRQYLVRLVDRLLYVLNNLDSENLVEGGISVGKLQGGGAAVLSSAAQVTGSGMGSANMQYIRAQVAEIVTAVIKTAVIDWAKIDSLEASMAQIYQATIDWAYLHHGEADTMFVARFEGERMYVDRLGVTAAQVVNLTVGTLCLKAADGNYYSLRVDPVTGAVTAEKTTVTEGEIAAGETATGRHIVETDLTADELYAGTVTAQEALISKLTAQRIDVGELFARAITTSTIMAAMGSALNLTSNQSVQAIVQNAVGEISNHFIVEDDRIRIFQQDDGSSYELQLTETEMAFVNQDTGEVVARFSTGATETDRMRSRDLLSVGRTLSGWYDMTVLESGVADKWRDGTGSGMTRPCVITQQPTDCLITLGDGNHPTTGTGSWSEKLSFTCAAEEAASYRWYYRYRRENATWTTVTGGTSPTMEQNVTPGRLGLEYRCKVTGLDGSEQYTRIVRPRIKGAPTVYGTTVIGADTVTQQYRSGNSASGSWTNSDPGSGTQYRRLLLTAASGAVAVTDEEVVTQ
ncbi:MAG: hypothetical protein IKS31_01395 [Clostridia bacterium]|nr:hypothetical protein [Clostridia bacterium]